MRRPESPVFRLWAAARDDEAAPQWRLAGAFVLVIAVSIAVASGLGDGSRALYTLLPALLTLIVFGAAGPGPGLLLGLACAATAALATLVAPLPLLASATFAAVIVWIMVPSRLAPPPPLAPLFQLVYFAVAAFAPAGTGVGTAVLFGAAGVAAGLALGALLRVAARLQTRETVTEVDEPARPDEAERAAPGWIEVALVATVAGGLLLALKLTESQDVAWVLLTFLLVYQPANPDSATRPLARVLGTFAGFAIVLALALIVPALLPAIGLAMLVPMIAFTRRDYVVSVAATTVLVVALYGVPDGEYLRWGVARLADTAVGSALALAVGAAARTAARLRR